MHPKLKTTVLSVMSPRPPDATDMTESGWSHRVLRPVREETGEVFGDRGENLPRRPRIPGPRPRRSQDLVSTARTVPSPLPSLPASCSGDCLPRENTLTTRVHHCSAQGPALGQLTSCDQAAAPGAAQVLWACQGHGRMHTPPGREREGAPSHG